MLRISHILPIFCLLLTVTGPTAVFPQPRDTLISRYVSLVMEGKADFVLPHLDSIRSVRARTPGLLFLEGLVSNEPDVSIEFFLEVAQQYPKSEWADDALVRLHDYYRAMGKDSLALLTLRRLQASYPLSPYLRVGYLPTDPARRGSSSRAEYAVQTGAFANRDNAVRMRDTLTARGYSIDIFENLIDGKRLYYLVWVGTFTSKVEAQKAADRMRERDGVFGVVRQRNVAQ